MRNLVGPDLSRVPRRLIIAVVIVVVSACGSSDTSSNTAAAGGEQRLPVEPSDVSLPDPGPYPDDVPVITVEDDPPPDVDEPPFAPVPDDGLIGLFGEKCLTAGPDAPRNVVPLAIDLVEIPTPADETGFELGPHEVGKDGDYRHPSEAEFWLAVSSDDGVIIGYEYLPNGQLSGDPSEYDLDCHPELGIYDDHGVLIGGWVDGLPVIAGQESSRQRRLLRQSLPSPPPPWFRLRS